MHTVGEKLSRARREKGVSLEEVYKQTRIHPHVLEALEQDRAHNFLSFLYIKGFLKTYARYLGLDGEKLLQEYVHSQKAQAPAPQFSVEKRYKMPPRYNPFLILRIAAVIILGIVFVFYFRFVARQISPPPQEEKVQEIKIEVMPAPEVVAEDLVLEVRTLDECWLRVKVDGKSVFEKTLAKGERERWQARQSLELRIGKPEALEVLLNGKPVDLEKAKVKRTLLITHEGVIGK